LGNAYELWAGWRVRATQIFIGSPVWQTLGKHPMSKRLGLYILVSLLAASAYLPGITDSLLADDWPVILRNLDLSLQDLPARFSSTAFGWYRPMFDFLIHLCFRMFGVDATGYHLAALFLYILTIFLVGDTAETITGKRPIGLAVSLLFGVHSIHSEPVLWISSMNELLAGVFVLLSLNRYIAFRRSRNGGLNYALAALLYVLGLVSKETAVFLPVMFVAYDVLLCPKSGSEANRIHWRAELTNLPFLAILILYLVFRLQAGSPYSTQVPLPRIAANILYYIAVQVFMLPENYGYWSSLSLWRQAPLLPIVSVGTSAVIMGTLVWLSIPHPRKEIPAGLSSAMKFSLSWSLVALGPVILTATGRTAFMSSIGVVWSVAILIFIIWDKVKDRNLVHRSAFALAIVAWVCINVAVTSYRAHWWRQAGEATEHVIRQLDVELATIPKGKEICLLGLPDHMHHAYTFRNAFPSMGEMLYPDYRIRATLDTESSGLAQHEDCIVYRYGAYGLERLDDIER
jgi:hypothetical protein